MLECPLFLYEALFLALQQLFPKPSTANAHDKMALWCILAMSCCRNCLWCYGIQDQMQTFSSWMCHAFNFYGTMMKNDFKNMHSKIRILYSITRLVLKPITGQDKRQAQLGLTRHPQLGLRSLKRVPKSGWLTSVTWQGSLTINTKPKRTRLLKWSKKPNMEMLSAKTAQ